MLSRRSIPWLVGATLTMASVAGCGAPAATPTPRAGELSLIFDDDGSRDGTVALLYLLSAPGISVEAVGMSYGEAHPETYAQHIGRVLDDLGFQDIPLGAGQDMPLAGGTPFPDWLRQLSDNFWEYPLPNADKTYPVQDAPELMVSTINQASEPVTLFVSGAFTNLAQALHLDPGIKDNIAAVYFMGGAAYSPGNIRGLTPESGNTVAEWNIYADPQAAREVFESGLEMYMVPLDATGQVLLNQEDMAPWHTGGKKGDLAADIYDMVFTDLGYDTIEVFDLTAAVIMARPELCGFESLHMDVVTEDGNTSGQTRIAPDGEPNINVCLEPDADRIKQELSDRFSGSQ